MNEKQFEADLSTLLQKYGMEKKVADVAAESLVAVAVPAIQERKVVVSIGPKVFREPFLMGDFILYKLGFAPSGALFESFSHYIESNQSDSMYYSRLDYRGESRRSWMDRVLPAYKHLGGFRYFDNPHILELDRMYEAWVKMPKVVGLLEQCLRPTPTDRKEPFTLRDFIEDQLGFRPASSLATSFHSTITAYYGDMKDAILEDYHPHTFKPEYWNCIEYLYDHWYRNRGRNKIEEHHPRLAGISSS